MPQNQAKTFIDKTAESASLRLRPSRPPPCLSLTTRYLSTQETTEVYAKWSPNGSINNPKRRSRAYLVSQKMGLEEQKEEREVLESIFPDEITTISDTDFRVSITLDVAEPDEAEIEPPSILLNVLYPEQYPDIGPNLDITLPPDASKYPLLDVSEDKARLLDSLQPIIEENLGMAMVFTLVSSLKDSTELLIQERQAAAQALKDVEAAKAEEEENRKFHGTAVTRESFLEWRATFRTEMEDKKRREQEDKEAEDRRKRGGKTEEKKLTGRQIWERGLANKFEEEDEDVVDATRTIQNLQV
ncbi:MAG: hypothetical protein Q9160_007930 [Pyrenula sp. 1 TL-2023]